MTQYVKNETNTITGDILILEDEPLMSALLKRYIGTIGNDEDSRMQLLNPPNTLQIKSLEGGFDLLETDLSSFKIAIIDILLPRVTGVDLVRHFRKKFPHMGIIAISGMATEPMKRQLRELLAADMSFLAKPLRKDDFLNAFIKAWNFKDQQPPQTSLSLVKEQGEELWTEVRPNQTQTPVQIQKRGLLRKKVAA
jgi:FixJ family two-component response regulator